MRFEVLPVALGDLPCLGDRLNDAKMNDAAYIGHALAIAARGMRDGEHDFDHAALALLAEIQLETIKKSLCAECESDISLIARPERNPHQTLLLLLHAVAAFAGGMSSDADAKYALIVLVGAAQAALKQSASNI